MGANHKELIDQVDGNQLVSKNYQFCRIGEPISIDSDVGSGIYDLEKPPSQPLALSERFGLLFIAHSTGFCVAKTRDVIDASNKSQGRASVQELSVVDVPIGKVSILALSADSSTLVVSVDDSAHLHFFSVTDLLKKERKSSFSCLVEDSSGIKDIRWTKNMDQEYLVLLENGKLYHGRGQDYLKNVADDVDAVEWSMRGDVFAVARNKVISILSSSFAEKLSMSLSMKSTVGDPDVNSSMKVDSIRWVRPDCIILGCFKLSDDGTEEGYLIQVIASQEGEITNPSSTPVILLFDDAFLGFMVDAVPFASSPHMFLSYLDRCQLAFITNRKTVDQHIVLFDWSTDDNKEAAMIEFLNDAWAPRIDCQGNGEDNIVIGLSIDNVSQDKQAKINFGEENEVLPCCVLVCLTVDGKLTFFHFASAIGDLTQQEANCTSSDQDEDVPVPVPTEIQLSEVLPKVDEQKRGAEGTKETATVHKSVHANIPQIISHDDYTGGKEKVKQVLDSQAINTQARMTPVVNLNFNGKGQLSNLPEQQENLKTGMSDRAVRSNVPKGFGVHGALPAQTGAGAVQDASLKSISSGPFISSSPAEGRSLMSPSSKFQMNQSNTSSTTLPRPQTNLPSKDFVSSFNLTPHMNKLQGSVESSPQSRSPQVPSKEKSALESSSNSAATTASSRLPSLKGLGSGPYSSKQFLSVDEMTKELDVLLEHTEGLGGFGDASMSEQTNSVIALEEGIWTLSERCGNWKGIMDKRLAKIQLILEKTVQALARKIYMEGIVKQATDSRYWDLWDHQKLSSELDLKRRHLLELNQELTNQLIDLEKHFNSLELNKFSESAGSQMNSRTMQSKHGSSRYVNSLHSLQNTMSAQLAAADQLSKCLSKQMAVLSIESPSIKKQNVKRDLFETIGIPYNDASFISPGERKAPNTSSKQDRLSLSSSVAAKEQSWRKDSTTQSSEPETARRRRDSLDRNWSSFNPPKTTVKRMLLQDNHQSPKTGRSSFVIDQQLFNRESERSAIVAAEPSSSSSAIISNSFKGKVTQNATTSRSPEIASTLFKTELHNASQPRSNFFPLLSQSTENSASGLNKLAVNDSKSTKQSEIDLQQTPASSTKFSEKILPSLKKTNTVPNSSDKQLGLSGLTSGNLKHEPVVTESLFPDKSNKIQSSAVLAFGSAPSFSYPGTMKSNPSQFAAASSSLSSYSSSGSHSVIDLSPPPPRPASPAVPSTAVSSGSLTINSNASVLKAPLHGSVASASISQTSENVVNSSVVPSLNFSYTTSSTEVVKPSIETDKKSEMLNSTSNSGLQIGRSDLKLEPPVTSKPTSEISTSSQSGSLFSFSVSPAATKPNPEQPSPAAVLSSASLSGLATANDQKIDNSAGIYTQEDEMEEEAPEESRSTEHTLGSLGGFGIGTIPTPTAGKSNPFGGSFTRTSSPSNPPFSMTVPGGELFKPASFSFPSPQPSQPSQPSNFASFAGGLSGGTTVQVPTGGFGHSAQTGAGQQALGSVLGSFGQSRQLGAGLPGTGIASAGGFGGFSGNQSAGGFVGNQPTGGFSSAAAGGGFASLASAGGGFSGIASAGSGFSGVSSSGSGFSAVASSGSGFSGGGFGGFSAVPPSGGGFGGAASGTFPSTGGGFGGFSNQGSGGFSSFGGSGGSVRPPPNLLTQMRK
ncbi:nuclear pore complex protein NUP214 [Heracleum sosnowskyi]|uniref:Nuclear pore complex protein NUP214 n=1 Tax=Heracleum sosnowskyi TaxID=360622 RepID=A0AAD8HGB4_9APIA|nr:nuclear pore complex protein NUP214 [Heracleum sosnowskyi]